MSWEELGKTQIKIDPSQNAVQLTGSIPEYGWLDTDDEPTPLEPTKFAMGVEINTTTHEMTTKYWTGSAWQEVL